MNVRSTENAEKIINPSTTNEYVGALMQHKGGVSFNVELTAASRERNYTLFGVERIRETIAYRDDFGAFRYKTMTHKLIDEPNADGSSSDGRRNTIYLCCEDNGMVHFYGVTVDEHGEQLATIIESTRVAKHIVDPMVAVLHGDNIIVTFNVPTDEMLSRGVRGRLPQRAANDNFLFISTGSLKLVACSLKQRSVRTILRTCGKLAPYYTFIASDAERNPVLFAVNLGLGDADDGGNADKKDEAIGFSKLFRKTFDTKNGSQPMPNTTGRGNEIPTGLSAYIINASDGGKQGPQLVQMSGSAAFNVSRVEIVDVDGGDTDFVRITVAGD